MTNLDFLLSDPQFTTFGEVAVAAEKIYAIDPAACVLVKRPAKGEKAKSPKSLIYWAFRGFLPKGANSEK